jgi:hypothetical protein
VEKVRINPGNFSGRPGRESKRITEREYEEGREEAREAFRPLVQLLKQRGPRAAHRHQPRQPVAAHGAALG